jgi:nucleoside-diphosphate-sugar epimerase
MRILVTGASSPLAARVVENLFSATDAEIWCGRHKREVNISDSRVRIAELDLESDAGLTSIHDVDFDLVIHFAGVTHTDDEQQYWKVNLEGTLRLARLVRANGCRRFVFVSTRCATRGSGAYGESKLAAEMQLSQLDWTSLLIIRPSEVYGGAGSEGVDRMLRLAQRWHIVPAFWGNTGIRFAPIHIDDFAAIVVAAIIDHQRGVRVVEASGPEELSGLSLAGRIARRHVAFPVPVWWPGFSFMINSLRRLGVKLTSPDQLDRLVSKKTAANNSSGNASEMVRFPE